jgi:hypothetical protein
MATISFDEATTTTDSKQLATTQPQANALANITTTTALAEKGLVGDWDSSDTRLPRINLVNKTGALGNDFTPGCWVINKEHQISKLDDKDKKKGEPIRVIALQMMKQYQENIPYDERESTPARLFNAAAEVREAGGSVTYMRGVGNFSEIATVEFLIQAPEWLGEDAEVHFYNIAEDGTRYTRAVATFASTSYSGVAVPLATSLRTHLAVTGLKGGQWDLGSVIMSKGDKTWWTPTIRTAGLVTEAQKNLIASLSM